MSETKKSFYLSPQAQTVLEYLRLGRALSVMTAITVLKVNSLTKRISELRAAGYAVEDEWAKDHHGGRYKKYSLKEGGE